MEATSTILKSKTNWFFLLAIFFILTIIGYFTPGGSDWYGVWRPASLELLAGRSPYNIPEFFMPPWALLPMLPLIPFPPTIGHAILFSATLIGLGVATYRLGGRGWTFGLFLASPPVLFSLWLTSVDWIPLIGFTLPPWLGLFFLAVKPQFGWVVALFWIVKTFRNGGYRALFKMIWPVSTAFLLSILIFGLWPLSWFRAQAMPHNTSLWPMSIPIGAVLAFVALRRRDIRYAFPSSPCLSPYLMVTSWSASLIPLLNYPLELAVAVIGFWVLVILRI